MIADLGTQAVFLMEDIPPKGLSVVLEPARHLGVHSVHDRLPVEVT